MEHRQDRRPPLNPHPSFILFVSTPGKLGVILDRLQLEPLALDAAAVYDPQRPRPRPTGVRDLGLAGESCVLPIDFRCSNFADFK